MRAMLLSMNDSKQKITELLSIDLKQDSIFDVIGKMEVSIGILEDMDEFEHINAFLKTYYYVTKNVATAYYNNKEQYEDYQELERLDVLFANKFFQPLLSYLNHQEKISPWQNFFEYNQSKYNIPFLQMLLGINAHINADLPMTLYEMKIDSDTDYQLINKILLETTPEVMQNLAFHEHDIFGAGGMVLKAFIEAEFNRIVVKWRNDAWANYQRLLTHDDPQIGRKQLNILTENIAGQLIELFSARSALKLHQFTDKLHELEVLI